MKKIIIAFALFEVIYSTKVRAQVTQEWIASYNGNGIGGYIADKGAVDKLGNFIVAGRGGFENVDYLLLKYNTSGSLLWDKRYNGPANNIDWFKDIVLDDSGNIYITGFSWEGTSLGGQNWVTIKYNSNGDLKWKQSLNWTGNNADQPYSICLDKNRNVLVAGYGFAGPTIFNDDIVVAKYSNNGSLLWTRSYNSTGPWDDWGYSVITDDSSNCYVSGYSKLSTNDTFNVIVTIKYDTNGNQKWVREFLRASSEYARPLYSKIDPENNVVICGNYNGNTDFVTLKYNSQGDLNWSRYFNGVGNRLDFCNAMTIDQSSNVYIAGRSEYPGRSHDLLLIKYKANGDTAFINYYDSGDSLTDEAFAVVVDGTGNIYISGSTTLVGDDFLTLKYDPYGNLLWSKIYSLPMTNISYAIDTDHNNNVFIAGYKDSLFYSSVVVIKYSQLTNISNAVNSFVGDYKLSNFPNPFNAETMINYEIPISGTIKLAVYDNVGKEIETLVDEYCNAGIFRIRFRANNYSSGVYYYALSENNNIIRTNKMLLIK